MKAIITKYVLTSGIQVSTQAVMTAGRTAEGAGKSRPRCSAHVDRLYKAVQNYVEKNGGKLAAIGGIAIQEWATDSAMVFHVAVKCCGRKPVWGCAERPGSPTGSERKQQ